MIGTKIYKNSYIPEKYAEIVAWCNEHDAIIQERETYFEVVSIPRPSLQELKENKLEQIANWTEKKITGGFLYNGVKYDSDVDTQITMQGIALNVNTPLFAEKYPEGCPVRGYDGNAQEKTVHYLSAAEVMGFCAALSMHIGFCKQMGWILQNRVHSAVTKEDLDAIVWAE